MMRQILRTAIALAALLTASPALAVEASFHTYDGFAETVDAFRLVSMIFADPRYETLVIVIATVGISLGALLVSVRGQGLGIVGFGFQMLVGIGLFIGLIATTGTVHVYDRVRNAYQPVGSVPNLLVLVAGTTNLIERALVETIDDNTLDPDSKIEFGAGGHTFDLFFNAVAPRGPMTDIFLDATIKDYVRQCYPVARVSPAYGVDDDKLFRTATDLPAAFAAMAGPATFSTVYTSTDKGGTTMSCDQAWQHISDRLADGRQWLVLTGFEIWEENRDDVRSDSWRRIGCTVVRAGDRDALLARLADMHMTAHHDMPVGGADGYHMHLGEHPWAWPDNTMHGWFEKWRPNGGDWQAPGLAVRPPTAEYNAESGGYDYSITQNITLNLPAGWLMDALNLHLSNGQSIEYRNAEDEVIFIDPSVDRAGRSAALVERTAFLEMLRREELVAVWAVAGEKTVFGETHSDGFGGRRAFTRLFHSDGGDLHALERYETFDKPSSRQRAILLGLDTSGFSDGEDEDADAGAEM